METGAISFIVAPREGGDASIAQTEDYALKDADDGSVTRSDSPSLSSLYRQIRSPYNSAASCNNCCRKLSPTDSGVCSNTRRSSSDASGHECYECPCPHVQHGDAGSELSWMWCPPEEIFSLSVEEVALSLRYIGMKESIIQRFREEQIDGKQMTDFDAELLGEGFPELNALDKKKVLDFVAGWRPKKLSSASCSEILLEHSPGEYTA